MIVGIRLGMNDHPEGNAGVFGLQLDGQDLPQIENILVRSNDLYRVIGDCGDEYRSRYPEAESGLPAGLVRCSWRGHLPS